MKWITAEDAVRRFEKIKEKDPNTKLCPWCYWLVQKDEDGNEWCPNELCGFGGIEHD
jgi:hypothetical protein